MKRFDMTSSITHVANVGRVSRQSETKEAVVIEAVAVFYCEKERRSCSVIFSARECIRVCRKVAGRF